MAWDPVSSSLVLFGGYDHIARTYLGDTWRWATQHARPLLTSTDLGRPVLAPVGKTVMLIEKPR